MYIIIVIIEVIPAKSNRPFVELDIATWWSYPLSLSILVAILMPHLAKGIFEVYSLDFNEVSES